MNKWYSEHPKTGPVAATVQTEKFPASAHPSKSEAFAHQYNNQASTTDVHTKPMYPAHVLGSSRAVHPLSGRAGQTAAWGGGA